MGVIEVDRSYIDNYAVKDFALNDLVPKYFDEPDISDRTVGMIGYTSEMLSNIAEDTFNAGSVLYRESFPNRAEIPESIYSHAAIYQLDDVFSKAAACKFILVMNENAIIQNMSKTYVVDADDNISGHDSIYRLYIDKDTVINVDEYSYVLDYDVQLSIIKKTNLEKPGGYEYIFTARYMMPEFAGTITPSIYKNSISNLKDPYIKIRRSSDGFIALEVQAHQAYREVSEEEIISHTVVNYSTIDVTYYGQLAGFDVLYQDPNTNKWSQLETRVMFSQPIRDPFCYYKMIDENTIRLSFNAEDNYFTPEFNAKLKVILYITDGADGNFDSYTGTNITIEPNTENYDYDTSFLTAARPIGSSLGGKEQQDLKALQEITVEQYRTATALTTEDDLQEYFNNYKYYYNNSHILFIKKRDDIYERVYSAFMLMKKNDDYIFNTNTLNLHLNIEDIKKSDVNTYMIEPGTLFTQNTGNGYADFLKDVNQDYNLFQEFKEYADAYNRMTTTEFEQYCNTNPRAKHVVFVDDVYDVTGAPAPLQRTASFALFKSRLNENTTRSIFDISKLEIENLDKPLDLKFLLMNPFLIYIQKNPNMVRTYLPFISNDSLLDFTYINDNSFVQFIAYNLKVERIFEKEKRYKISVKVSPSVELSKENSPINQIRNSAGELEYVLNDKFVLADNSLRVIVELRDENQGVAFTELYPSAVENKSFIFSNYINTDDNIYSNSHLRLLEDTIYRFYTEYYDDDLDITYPVGDYFVYNEITTKYDLYDKNNEYKNISLSSNKLKIYIEDKIVQKYNNIIKMNNSKFISVPMSDCICKVYMLYNKTISSDNTTGVLEQITETDNKFASFDNEFMDTYDFYICTNEYTTGTYPITFMKPLNSVRSYLSFKDYKKTYSDETLQSEILIKNVITGDYYKANDTDPITYSQYDFNENLIRDDIRESEMEYKRTTELLIETTFINEILDIDIDSVSFVRAALYNNMENLNYFFSSFSSQYDFLVNIINTNLRNETNMDIKLYNTYGRSSHVMIGEDNELLDTVNIGIEFDIWFVEGTDLDSSLPLVKNFIKENIETLNSNGLNNIYVSNLMRKLETNFSFIDHIRFVKINNYISTYQTVRTNFTDLNELDVISRRKYVPEFMVVDMNDIIINEFFV